ncbi:class I SAM-dependent methyltransferase [Ideonella sp. YS5]
MNPDLADREAWSHYWAGVPLASGGCLPGLPRPAAAALESLWATFFRALPPGARVLDLGTGAGAVPRFASTLRKDLKLLGVDYVKDLTLGVPNLEFVGGVAMEALPFADAQFDAVTSQFSIEYAKEPAPSELLRVLKPDAAWMVVAHHSRSVILEQNRRRLAALDDLCGAAGLLETAGGLADRPHVPLAEARQALRPLIGTLQQRHPGQGIVTDAASFVLGVLGHPLVMDELRRVQGEMGMEQLRLRALLRAALDDEAVQALATKLSRSNHPALVDAVPAPGTGLPLAWSLRSR